MGDFGIRSRGELLAAGYTERGIRVAVHAERLTRLRPGWYAFPGADADICRAVTAGGGLTCISALARQKVWVPESATGLHVRLAERARRRPPRGLVSCGTTLASPLAQVDDVPDAVLAAAGCITGTDLTAVFDSVLNRGLLQPSELVGILRDQPRRVHRALAGADGSAESGTETRVRLHLRRRRLVHRTQVFIPGVGHVDLLVGTSLVIECDSEAHHAGEAIETDRDRDLELHALGFVPLRVSYDQVFHHFARVEAAIERRIADGDHLRRTDYTP